VTVFVTVVAHCAAYTIYELSIIVCEEFFCFKPDGLCRVCTAKIQVGIHWNCCNEVSLPMLAVDWIRTGFGCWVPKQPTAL